MRYYPLLVIVIFLTTPAFANPLISTHPHNNFNQFPWQLSPTAAPLTLLALDLDLSVLKPAYNDFSDLNNDHKVDSSYNDQQHYIGYFDAEYCYHYSDESFYPSVKIDVPTAGKISHQCSQKADWSGNFLNWASMTHLDLLRLHLYGGKRSIDSNQTQLQRANLLSSHQSFNKVFTSKDMHLYTPFSYQQISLCHFSQTAANGSINPVFNIARKAFPRWGKAGRSCDWNSQHAPSALLKIHPTMTAAVIRCVAEKDAIDHQHCRTYNNGVSKPVGLLQIQAEVNNMQFAMMSHHYHAANHSASTQLIKQRSTLVNDGKSKHYEINLDNGKINQTFGMIAYLNRLETIFKQSIGDACLSTTQCNSSLQSSIQLYQQALAYLKYQPPTQQTNASQAIDNIVWPWQDPFLLQQNCIRCGIMLISNLTLPIDAIRPVNQTNLHNETATSAQAPDSTNTPTMPSATSLAQLAYVAKNSDLRPHLMGQQSANTLAFFLNDQRALLAIADQTRKLQLQASCYIKENACQLIDIDIKNWSTTSGIADIYWQSPDSNSEVIIQTLNWCTGDAGCATENNVLAKKNKLQIQQSIHHAKENSAIIDYHLFSDNKAVSIKKLKAVHTTKKTISDQTSYVKKSVIKDQFQISYTPLSESLSATDNQKKTLWKSNQWQKIQSISNTQPINYNYSLSSFFSSLLSPNKTQKNSHISKQILTDSAIYQTLFQLEDSKQSNGIEWSGIAQALFVDSYGYLREDNNKNGRLDDEDYAIDFITTDTKSNMMFKRFTVDKKGEKNELPHSLYPINQLETLWNARENLALVPNPKKQRRYDIADANRYIITSIDGQIKPFTQNDMLDYAAYFSLDNAIFKGKKTVKDLVNYIRGLEQQGYRSRTYYSAHGNKQISRLGDMINSSAVLVAKPKANYYSQYQDSSYLEFIKRYEHRRQVLYVGANDGMLHAFNAGFWNEQQQQFSTQSSTSNKQFPYSEHKLGAELWAYIPQNLLPKLHRLADNNYQHTHYVDGPIQSFDVRIFDHDADHPQGWGTILVVGTGLGGAEYTISSSEKKQQRLRPAYSLLDISNPEKPPTLLAEISHPLLGLTLADTSIIKAVSRDFSKASSKWQLTFVSGPSSKHTSTTKSSQATQLFTYDLIARDSNALRIYSTDQKNSYGGDITVVDRNQDYIDDRIYFGTINDTGIHNPLSGSLQMGKINITQDSISNSVISSEDIGLSTWLQSQLPISLAPMSTVSADGHHWLIIATGRSLTLADKKNQQQQYVIGLKDKNRLEQEGEEESYTLLDLINTGGIRITHDQKMNVSAASKKTQLATSTIENYAQFETFMQQHPGWKLPMSNSADRPSGKVISQFTTGANLVLAQEYLPAGQVCNILGSNHLHRLNLTTGTYPSSKKKTISKDTAIQNTEVSANPSLFMGPSIGSGSSSAYSKLHRAQHSDSLLMPASDGNLIKIPINYPDSQGKRLSWQLVY